MKLYSLLFLTGLIFASPTLLSAANPNPDINEKLKRVDKIICCPVNFISVTAHELGHAIPSKLLYTDNDVHVHIGRRSDSTAAINPLIAVRGFTVHSIVESDQGYYSYSYPSTPANELNYKKIVVSAGGPIAGAIVSGVCAKYCIEAALNNCCNKNLVLSSLNMSAGILFALRTSGEMSQLTPFNGPRSDGYSIGQNLGISEEKLNDPQYLPNKIGKRLAACVIS